MENKVDLPGILQAIAALVVGIAAIAFMFSITVSSLKDSNGVSVKFEQLISECTAYCDAKMSDVPVKCFGNSGKFLPQYYGKCGLPSSI